jgi:hypothetical protein
MPAVASKNNRTELELTPPALQNATAQSKSGPICGYWQFLQ